MRETAANVKKHYGFALVRALMCFVVVLSHFWEPPSGPSALGVFAELRQLAVPVFMMASFYLVGKSFFDIQPNVVKKRMWRLIWPHVAWSLIYWIIYFPFGQARFQDLFWQLLTGHSPSLNATMWFQIAMIVLTLLFLAVFRVMEKKQAVIVLGVLGCFALLFQYSGLNYGIFAQLRYELSYPIGRLAEVMPYAVLGIYFAYFQVSAYFMEHRVPVVIGAAALGVCGLLMENVSFLQVPGFGYSGIAYLLEGTAIFVIASAFPMYGVPNAVKKMFDKLSQYTLGIYCMHRLVQRVVSVIAGSFLCDTLGIPATSFVMCLILYAVCYLCAAVMWQIPVKWIKQLVQ